MRFGIGMKLLLLIGIFILLLVLYPRQATAQCLGTKDSCCSSLDCADYCSDSFYRKYSGLCRVTGTPCVYSIQFCEYGCENGACKVGCEVGYVDNYTCSGDWVQRQYRHSDCTFSWENYNYCNYGCNNGACNPICPQPLNEYKCVGSDLYQKYQACDRTYDWNVSQHCDYGCFNNACLASPPGPSEIIGSDTAGTAIKIVAVIVVIVLIYFIIIKMRKTTSI